MTGITPGKQRPWKERVKDAADFMVHEGLKLLPTDGCSRFGALAAKVRGPKAYPLLEACAHRNLRRLRPEWTEAEIAAAGSRRWENIGRLMTEYSVLHRLMPEGRVAIEGVEHLQRALKDGPVVLLGLHLGNWEVLAAGLRSLGVGFAAFYDPPDTRSRDLIAARVRGRLGVELLRVGAHGSVRAALKAMAAGRPVGIFGDEAFGGSVRGPFFGRAPHVQGNLGYAVRFARRFGAAVVPGYVLRTEGCRFMMRILEPVPLSSGAATEDGLLTDVMLLNDLIEPIVRAHVDQWYFLHEEIDDHCPQLEADWLT